MNTKQFGKLRMFVYKSGEYYVGVCLELDEIVWEKTKADAIRHLLTACEGYLEAIAKDNLPDSLLNEKTPLKYRLIYYFGTAANAICKMKDFFSIEIPMFDGHYGIPLLV